KPAGTTSNPVVWTPNVEGASPAITLVNAGFLRTAPTNFWVAQNGSLYVLDTKCGTIGTAAG
ncbi:MAG: hypothetical protein JWL72_1210, partial [Ilumatobacteraceae bacterium]|nr:hypothetical protein [Ilumatobacteraceae bacterium]